MSPGMRRRAVALTVLGTLLLQAAWILAVPPFRGSDEFDHAYRAASVADGQFLPSVPAERGRGLLVAVPEDLVVAAGPQCRSLEYTGHDNCNRVEQINGDTVTVATAAAHYPPHYYWVVGTAAQFFEGSAALYVMRLSGAVLCALFLGLAAWAVSLWARTVWPWFGLFLCLTPVFLYSTALPATNGLEMAASVLAWTSLTGLARVDPHTLTERALIWCAVPAVMVLATLRQLGPGFVAIIFGVAALLLGWQGVRTLVSRHAGTFAILGLAVVVSFSAAVLWMRASGSTELEPIGEVRESTVELLAAIFRQTLGWNLQVIAAFPLRNEPAPPFVYAAYGLVLLGFIGYALTIARDRLRLILSLLIALTVVLPMVLTFMTVREAGLIWQGRYGLPVTVGVAILAGICLDRPGKRHRLGAGLLPIGVSLLAMAHTVSVTHVFNMELEDPVSAQHSGWVITAPSLVASIALCAWGAWAYLLARCLASGREVAQAHELPDGS